jgi:hypothetical protein
MTISLPSKKAILLDAPGELDRLSLEFVYNFFVPDECVNEQPQNTLPNLIRQQLTSTTQNVTLQNILKQRKYERYVPRYINIGWTPVTIGIRPDLVETVSIADNIAKVQDEESLAGNTFSSVAFRDNGVDGKVNFAIKRSMEEMLKSQGIKNPSELNTSPLEMVKLLNTISTQDVQGNFLAESFVNLKTAGIDFIDKPKLDATIQSIADELRNVKLKTNLNNKFIGTILKSATQEVDNIFGDETLSILPGAQDTQEKTIAQNPSYIVNAKDYQIDLNNYIAFEPKTKETDVIYQIIGYIINKVEYPYNGQPITKGAIVIENPTIANFTDLNIKYGTKYGYSIRSVFLLKIPGIEETTGQSGLISFLISSQASPEFIIDCREVRPPNPPTDFNIGWDYERNMPRITWGFPVDSQRDVKYFQLFRRANINQPYQLIKMYAFNDSITPLAVEQLPEYNINPEVVENLRTEDGSASAKNYYLDPEFQKETTAIYTVCAIDAHGLSSNYSTQIEISFDKFKNKIVKKLISVAGSPKAYPNFFLNQDTFVDSIRTNNASKLSIYFNPEYLKVFDRAGNDLKLIKTDISATYKLQMINVDLQKDYIIDIAVKETSDPIPTNVNQIKPPDINTIQVTKLR